MKFNPHTQRLFTDGGRLMPLKQSNHPARENK